MIKLLNPHNLDVRKLLVIEQDKLLLEHHIKIGMITVYEILNSCKYVIGTQYKDTVIIKYTAYGYKLIHTESLIPWWDETYCLKLIE